MPSFPPTIPSSSNNTNPSASNNRKMRRPRDATSSSAEGDIPSGYDLYAIQGDSAAALKIFQQQLNKRQEKKDESSNTEHVKDSVSVATIYNHLLLSYISSTGPQSTQSNEAFLKSLQEMELLHEASTKSKHQDGHQLISTRKFRRNEFILAYNSMLVLHATGQVRKCAQICSEKLSGMIYEYSNRSNANDITTKLSDQVAAVAIRMSFLMLECILSMAVGRNGGLKDIASNIGVPPVEMILEWIESLPLVHSGTSGSSDTQSKDPQLKFLFNLYKTRLALADLDNLTGKHVDSHIRSARKDMKTAMEIFQHKLRASFGAETSSVVSSANSEENVSTSAGSVIRPESNHNPPTTSFPPTGSSVVLQKLNQSALSLKAHLEQMKGNTKKSLILCTEAVGVEEGTIAYSGYDAVHYNNLSVVYETVGKCHLALHALTKALRANSDNGIDSGLCSLFHPDGTVRPNITFSLLHNAGICALRARNYMASYECIATCVARSEIFYNRPSSWIRMAQACIGIWTAKKRHVSEGGVPFRAVHIDGEPQAIVIDNKIFKDDADFFHEDIEPILASPGDLDQVGRNPLLRAQSCLDHALQYESSFSVDTLFSVLLSSAYICLAFGNFARALELSKRILNSYDRLNEADEVTYRLRKRQEVTARMYAAEASCALGNVVEGLQFLVGAGNDDAIDRLASDLAGVSLEVASTNEKSRRRLAKAQTMVRSSVCAMTAALGSSKAAKQLANSANVLEESHSLNQDMSSARKALLYTLLRDGNQSHALKMLLSLHS